MVNEALNRPQLARRADYKPAAPQEEFIVPLLRSRIEQMLRAHSFPAPKGGKAIDVGCGRQPFRAQLEELGYAYTGMDVQQNPEGTVDLLCALDGPLPPEAVNAGPFDLVICTEVLEHVADWAVAFKSMNVLMAPGGKALITCPHFYQLHEKPHDYWRPTLYALRHFAAQEGLRVLHAEAAGDAWAVLGTLLANCRPDLAGDLFLHRVFLWMALRTKAMLFFLLKKRWLQRLVSLQGPLYLSNIIVLEKPVSAP
jgi:SAM-dependent methyltransferase